MTTEQQHAIDEASAMAGYLGIGPAEVEALGEKLAEFASQPSAPAAVSPLWDVIRKDLRK